VWTSLLLLLAICIPQAQPAGPRVLLLNSYHDGYEWTDDIVHGASEVLRGAKKTVQINTEYMDIRRHRDPSFLDTLADFYKIKFAKRHFDAIIASDDPAIKFLLKRHDEIFPGVPVIFCGLNEYRGSSGYIYQNPEARKWLTGVVETVDVEETIGLALKLLPGTKTIVTVGEAADLHYDVDSQRAHPGLNVRRLNTQTLPLEEIGKELAGLPSDSIVLLSAFSRDSSDHQLSLAESSQFVCERSAVPVFGLNKNTLGRGIVGGKLTDGYFQGFEAAKYALAVLNGTPPSAIPIRTESSNHYVFDDRQLRRWGIANSALPSNSIVIERPRSFYQRHPVAVWGISGFIMAQGLVISFLIANILKRKRIQRALEESEARFRNVFENSRDAIGVSVEDIFVYVNPAWAQMYGYDDPAELVGVSLYALVAPESREDVRERRRSRSKDIPVHSCYETRGLRKDHTTIDTEVRASLFVENGKVHTLAILRDITAEKQAAEILRESERQLDIALQAGRMGMWRWNAATNVSTWSPTQESLFGLSVGGYDGTQEAFVQSLHPDDREAVLAAVARAVQTGEDYRMEYRIRWPDGTERWLAAQGKVFLDPSGQPRGITGVTWDVTERRQAEDRIRYQLQLTQAITTHAAESLFLTDEKGRITFVNPAAERTFGWREDELLGRVFHETFHHHHPDGSLYAYQDCPIIAECRSGETVRNHEDIFFHKNGSPMDIICSQTPIVNNDRITGAVMVVHDVTGMKQAARELHRQEEQFRRVFEESPVGMALVTPDYRYEMVNPALAQMLGYESAELLNRSFREVTHPDDLLIGQEESAQLFRGELARFQIEKRCISRKGDIIWANLNLSSFRDPKGSVLFNLVLVENITERKLAEQELARQAHELALSNADLQQFAYVTSHDLQEPLRNIASFSQMLGRRYQGRLDADADEFIGYIITGVDRMRALIQDLLGYSRVVNSERAPFGPVHISEAVDWALNNLRQTVDASGTTIHMDKLPVVTGDRVLLVQLFQNLVGNAIKYRSATPPEIWISAEPAGHGWIFSVKDNGIGIDPHYHERIFGVFKRLHGREFPGTGIGLAICRKIVEKHGGKIWVESRSGEGSTFRFTLNL
jgi:PAS domain S-box-containing protein